MRKSIAERMWAKVERRGPDECWMWTGGGNGTGYGRMIIETIGGKNKMAYPHRVAYESVNGEIPKGMLVCHRCDVRKCCNPSHLFIGTHKDNSDDMTNKGRRISGAKSHLSKLKEQEVLMIRHLLSNGEKQVEIAKKFSIAQTSISNIKLGKTWRVV